METMSPQQQHESLNRSQTPLAAETKTGAHYENKRRMKSLSHRRQSAPSLVISKALTRSKTLSKESFLAPVCPETLPLVQSFLSPDRAFLLHGHAQLKAGLQTQDRHLFLFTDLLIVAKSKWPTHFKMKTQAFVCEMWTAGCVEEVCEASSNPDKSFVMGWPTYNCVAMFSSSDQKERWLSLLKSRIKDEKEKDDPKTIPLKVLGKGISSFFPSKTLAVSNSDTTNEVVRLALQQFGIAGCVKDYQLWVSSKRENAPYPLIGHEFPFSILISHVREPLYLAGGGREAATPPGRQRALHPEQLVDKQCQFILKPRRITAAQHHGIDPGQKPFKRRRSLINWAFWRGSTSQLHDSSFSSPASGCLFGQPLSAVCQNDALPKPVMDMLVFLYHEGAFTRGIFRRSAGARACRELRDTLDAGAQEIPLTREHVFIIAGVFKDFLRNIPGSLLCSDLYEQWMDVMEETEGEEEVEQIGAVESLVGRLPKEHALLLRYVVAVLHGIQGNAHDNQMNAFNLSVCIAPSMLWAPGPSSPEMEGEGAKKVCDLVRFIIEHCQELLGEDVTSLFGGPPDWGRFCEQGSDVSSFQLTDSSYDSLDNELNGDSSESPGLHTRRGRRRTRVLQSSLDSVLTLSDNDLDQPDTCASTQPGNPNRHHNVLQLPASARPKSKRLPSAAAPSCPSPPGSGRGPSDSPDPLSMGGLRRLRRCSEPAISYKGLVTRVLGNSGHMGSIEALGSEENDDDGDDDDEEEEEGYKEGVRQTHTQTVGVRRGACESAGPRGSQSLLHGTSCSSLSSPPTSPTPTRSSFDSLDSLQSHCGDHPALIWLPRSGGSKAPGKRPPPSAVAPLPTPVSTSSVHISGPVSSAAPAPANEPCPESSPPKEAFSWSALRSGRGLHPNTWLKKARRMSLQQQDNADAEKEERKSGGRPSDKTLPGQERGGGGVRQLSVDLPRSSGPWKGGGAERGRVTQDRSPPPPRQEAESPPSHHRSLGQIHYGRSPCYQPSDKPLTVRELREIHSQACLQHQYGHTGSDVLREGQVTGREGGESKRLPQDVFFGQTGPFLSMARPKSHSLTPPMDGYDGGRLFQRRSSEPGAVCLSEALGLDRASTLHLERLHSEAKQGQTSKLDPGLKVSEVEPLGGQARRSTETQFCLSPSATKTVRDYFSSHRRSNPQGGKQVALALVQGKRERMRRCSDPMLEPDFDKLLFAEESYV
ncbi:rho GTPase-activating protein 20-like [Hypomesus transpacificus]|uniref:rho GTPase-activating protein 20-like n=1 Tax=Hypomesus transpacificus TaxID=137520 RepID=UPI001F085BD7|nr:rho GTPase-activating protein 20-like [Hypomesus transpacificus]XP_046886489.1 rho GTPase-activating protein 20-like [Hypomesus transpacificus]